MYRKIIEDLRRWKYKTGRKPLVLKGARQVGKTWIMKAFGREEYERVAYVNFDNNSRMQNLFAGDYDIPRLILGLQIESETQIHPETTLVILDEIQEVPKALSALKYFQEKTPQYHMIAAGSLLKVALNGTSSFPVGKVDFLDMYPLDFEEFLMALGHFDLLSLIHGREYELITAFRGRYIELLKQYYLVGGMPEVVSHFSEHTDMDEVRSLQNSIVRSYELDFSKHAPPRTALKMRQLWQSVPSQLSRENKKFVYGLIRDGARAREYEDALRWLSDSGLIHIVNRVTKPAIPLSAYEDQKAFKIYLVDLGLLCTMSELDPKSVLEGNEIFVEFKGAITEQFVLQQLKSGMTMKPYYYSSDTSSNEIDFIMSIEGEPIPVEVKAETNLQSKSLKSYIDKFHPSSALRLSLSDYKKEKKIENIPLYTGFIPYIVND